MQKLPINVAKSISGAEFLNALYKSFDFASKFDVRKDETRHVRLGPSIPNIHLDI